MQDRTSAHKARREVRSFIILLVFSTTMPFAAAVAQPRELQDQPSLHVTAYSYHPFQWSLTITNPFPEPGDAFGGAVAAVGVDGILVGAAGANLGGIGGGAAFLFDLAGRRLATFSEPSRGFDHEFGISVAAVGVDKIVIGASGTSNHTGAAYLFARDGSLLATFANPRAQEDDFFGIAVAGVGTERVLVGSDAAGEANLFGVDGELLTTVYSPDSPSDGFGRSVAAIGEDTLLIGAPYANAGQSFASGRAYLFDIDGELRATFFNPREYEEDPALAHANYFGFSVAPVSNDKVLVGAPGDRNDEGSAYLFDLDGERLATFANPDPEEVGWFGNRLTGLGHDKVVIAATMNRSNDFGPGVVYVFDLDGTLLSRMRTPFQAQEDGFGSSIAVVGTSQIVVGARSDDTGANRTGAAHLFSPTEPVANAVKVSWDNAVMGFVLDSTTSLLGPINTTWTQVPFPYQTNSTEIFIIDSMPVANKFYRLRNL